MLNLGVVAADYPWIVYSFSTVIMINTSLSNSETLIIIYSWRLVNIGCLLAKQCFENDGLDRKSLMSPNSRNDPNPAFMGEQLLKLCIFLKFCLTHSFFVGGFLQVIP